jgi:hypothetical protein
VAQGTRLGSELSAQHDALGSLITLLDELGAARRTKGGAAGTGRPSPVSAVTYGFGVACGVHVTSLLSSVPLTR